MADNVYFETGDTIDEASLVAALDRPQLTDYVATGLGLTADYGVPDVDVASGRAFIGGYTVEADARTGVSLTDAAVNYVYLELDTAVDESVSVTVNTTGSDPANPSLLLGTVDTGADTKSEENRTPNFDGEHSGTFDGELVSTTGDHAGPLTGTLAMNDPSLIYVWGANGDLVDTYDPASYGDILASMNDVMADAPSNSRVTIELPYTGSAGVSASTTFSVPSGKPTPNIKGHGRTAAVINYTATDGTPAIEVPDPVNKEDYVWEGFHVSGPGSGASGGGNGVEIGDSSTDSTNHQQRLSIAVTDFPGTGLAIYGYFTGKISRCAVRDNGQDGVYVQRLNVGSIENCDIEANGRYQVWLDDCIRGVIEKCIIDSAGGGAAPAGSVGVRVANQSKQAGPVIADNYFEANETHVLVESPSGGVTTRGVVVEGNSIRQGTTGVHIASNTDSTTIKQNWFDNVGTQDILLDGTGARLGENTHINSTTEVADNVSGSYQVLDPKIVTDTTVSLGASAASNVNSVSDVTAQLDVSVTPANDPGSDHGYELDRVWWDDSQGRQRIRVVETEGVSGGDARVVARQVFPYPW